MQEIEGHIYELVDDNLEKTKNVDLELKFQKYQREKNKLDAFRLKLDEKKHEYSAIYVYNLDSRIQYNLKTSQHFHHLSVPISFKKYIIYFSKLICHIFSQTRFKHSILFITHTPFWHYWCLILVFFVSKTLKTFYNLDLYNFI